MTDIMMDLETWGKTPGHAVRSVAAVAFSRDSDEIGEEFYRNIDTWSSILAGLKIDPGTSRWWSTQPREAQEVLMKDKRPLAQVVLDFHNWVLGQARGGPVRVWAQGTSFDIPIWEAAASAVNARVPWRYFDTRDTRTVYDLAGLTHIRMKELRGEESVLHSAIHDSRHQANCVRLALQIIRNGGVENGSTTRSIEAGRTGAEDTAAAGAAGTDAPAV